MALVAPCAGLLWIEKDSSNNETLVIESTVFNSLRPLRADARSAHVELITRFEFTAKSGGSLNTALALTQGTSGHPVATDFSRRGGSQNGKRCGPARY
jgi:hypothetical protein